MDTFDLGARTFLLHGEGGDYRLHLAVPDGAAPAGGWPALYLLDAYGCFATAVEAMRRMSRRPDATGAGPALVAGITSASGHDVGRRELDFTSRSAGAPERGGGADRFLALLERQVIPLVEKQAPADRHRRTLLGHSLGGYFALWALCRGSPAFQRYCAVSPSIWWDEALLHAAAPGLAGSDRHVELLMGEWEDRLPPWQAARSDAGTVRARRAARDMTGSARAFAALLAGVLGPDRARFSVLAEEDHASIVSAAVPRALRLASRLTR
ncbi:alpha/beta hydrolase [Novosphingobium resinovorum]|uniref:alpha/beta hydrolase n=1 Tax=Novosphingobium resinovorum TaxID=158500 RepID=UPI002ED47432|nr:alpha/beta hydrolase-fold protein [Novosphingobium resinovorum]